LPIPERIYYTPTIDGRLANDGEAVRGARVVLADERRGATCVAPTASTTTDSVGAFRFLHRRTTVWITIITGHTGQNWALCLVTGGDSATVIARAWHYRIGGGLSHVRVDCDVTVLQDAAQLAAQASDWLSPLRPGAPCRYVDARGNPLAHR
jgi:hypothetical protein